MQKRFMLVAMAGLSALAGCNSTDMLTPQVDVGGGTFNSPPVNQKDLDTMSEQTAYAMPQPSQPVQSVPFSTTRNDPAPPTVMEQGDTAYNDPPGTLDAQAGQLSRGDMPAQNRQRALPKIDEQPIDESDTAVLENTPARQKPAPVEPAEKDTAERQEPAEQQPQSAALAPQAAAGTIRFLPIIGAPVSAVTPLSKQLGAQARAEGLTIKSASDPSSQHILKGYFSVLKDGRKTTVIYVWDVLDGSGNRLHRIQGQESVEATASDLWAAVPGETMQTIATRTIDAYMDWRREQAG